MIPITEGLRSILLGTAGLTLGAMIALALTLARGGVRASDARLQGAARLATVVILIQTAHFAEELATGFPRRFPALLGLAPWPLAFFLPFNLVWLAVWGLSLRGLLARRRAALWALWFLALASLVNGVAHPALALRAGGYFPGLATAPLVGVAGALLARRLLRVTGGESPRGIP